jgi:hypothetical protein
MHGIHLMVDSIMADLFPTMGSPGSAPAPRIVGKSNDLPQHWHQLDPSMPIITMVYDGNESWYIVIAGQGGKKTLPTKTTWKACGLGFFPGNAVFVTRSVSIGSGNVLVYTTRVGQGSNDTYPLASDFMRNRRKMQWKQYSGQHQRGLDDKSRKIMQQLVMHSRHRDGNVEEEKKR